MVPLNCVSAAHLDAALSSRDAARRTMLAKTMTYVLAFALATTSALRAPAARQLGARATLARGPAAAAVPPRRGVVLFGEDDDYSAPKIEFSEEQLASARRRSDRVA